MIRRRTGRLRPIGHALDELLAQLNPLPNGKGPEPEPLVLSPWDEPQPTGAADRTRYAYTFERFRQQTAHLTGAERLYVFLALPEVCRREMWRTAQNRSNGHAA